MANSSEERYYDVEEADAAFFVKVQAVVGLGESSRRLQCHFDSTGRITNLPLSALWGGIVTKDDHDARTGELVRRFNIELVHQVEGVIVAQRGEKNHYRASQGASFLQGELLSHSFAPCDVSYHIREDWEQEAFDLGPVCVWMDPMSKDPKRGTNRLDVWIVDKDGKVTLFCVYLVTLDDGETFRSVGQTRWVGKVYRRKPGTTHILRSKDPRIRGLFERKSEVRDILNRFVIVPGEHTENFETRMQILENPEFRTLIEALDVPVWQNSDDFWIERPLKTGLLENQGVVKFLTYGVGKSSFGIIRFHDEDVQFDHRAIVGDLTDDQGIFFLAPGTIVDIEGDLVDMDRGPQKFPPKARKVIPRMIPVPFDSEVAETR